MSPTPAPHRSRRAVIVPIVLALLALGVASCTSSDDGGASGPVPPALTTTTGATSTGAGIDVIADPELYRARTTTSQRASLTVAGRRFAYADALQAEQQGLSIIGPAPIGGFRYEDVQGEFTTIEDGIRKTLEPTCSCPKATVWFVGGSAAFGTGQPDDRTIASELVRRAEADGIALEVVNLSLPGWTRWQEYQGLVARLASGAPPPDLVISYGGFNDVIAYLFEDIISGGADEDHPTAWDIRLDAGVADALVGGRSGGPSTAIGERAGARATQVAVQMRAAAHAAGAEILFVAQPDALASEGQDGDLVDWIGPAMQPEAFAIALAGLDDALAAAAEATGDLPDGLDLRSIYDGFDERVFPDSVHTTEAGTPLVAAAIWEAAAPLLPDR